MEVDEVSHLAQMVIRIISDKIMSMVCHHGVILLHQTDAPQYEPNRMAFVGVT